MNIPDEAQVARAAGTFELRGICWDDSDEPRVRFFDIDLEPPGVHLVSSEGLGRMEVEVNGGGAPGFRVVEKGQSAAPIRPAGP